MRGRYDTHACLQLCIAARYIIVEGYLSSLIQCAGTSRISYGLRLLLLLLQPPPGIPGSNRGKPVRHNKDTDTYIPFAVQCTLLLCTLGSKKGGISNSFWKQLLLPLYQSSGERRPLDTPLFRGLLNRVARFDARFDGPTRSYMRQNDLGIREARFCILLYCRKGCSAACACGGTTNRSFLTHRTRGNKVP